MLILAATKTHEALSKRKMFALSHIITIEHDFLVQISKGDCI